MRLPVDLCFKRLLKGITAVALTTGIAACAASTSTDTVQPVSASAPTPRPNGPAADYPITVGDPFVVNGTEYVPTDTMNYDHVGYVTLDTGAMGYTGSHHTLPVPSYVEVTSLDTGRTILVRLERRGPMNSNHLIALSPAALAQLGGSAETPVRVRRVNPPEEERFALRSGDAAPLRMETPQSLLSVLQRRVPESGVASLSPSRAVGQPDREIETIDLAASAANQAQGLIASSDHGDEAALPTLPRLIPSALEEDASEALARSSAITGQEEAPAPTPQPVAEGRYVVQAAAFSTRERADRAANVLGGMVTQAGQYWRVRTGPFATRGEAEASLANVRRAGYSDARILTSG